MSWAWHPISMAIIGIAVVLAVTTWNKENVLPITDKQAEMVWQTCKEKGKELHIIHRPHVAEAVCK